MIRLALILTLITTAVSAQDTKFFFTKQECYPLTTFMNTVVNKYEEDALFTGTGVTISADGTPFTGGSMFFVNQDTGTWTLSTLYADGTVCVNGAGTNFEPYTD